jgi:hypothetical protein
MAFTFSSSSSMSSETIPEELSQVYNDFITLQKHWAAVRPVVVSIITSSILPGQGRLALVNQDDRLFAISGYSLDYYRMENPGHGSRGL